MAVLMANMFRKQITCATRSFLLAALIFAGLSISRGATGELACGEIRPGAAFRFVNGEHSLTDL